MGLPFLSSWFPLFPRSRLWTRKNSLNGKAPTFLLNGKAAILSHFTSLDPTITSHPQPGKDKNGLPNAVGGSLAAKVPQSIYSLIPALFRAALERFYSRPPSHLRPLPRPRRLPSAAVLPKHLASLRPRPSPPCWRLVPYGVILVRAPSAKEPACVAPTRIAARAACRILATPRIEARPKARRTKLAITPRAYLSRGSTRSARVPLYPSLHLPR